MLKETLFSRKTTLCSFGAPAVKGRRKKGKSLRFEVAGDFLEKREGRRKPFRFSEGE